jgi:hypothetical protein
MAQALRLAPDLYAPDISARFVRPLDSACRAV